MDFYPLSDIIHARRGFPLPAMTLTRVGNLCRALEKNVSPSAETGLGARTSRQLLPLQTRQAQKGCGGDLPLQSQSSVNHGLADNMNGIMQPVEEPGSGNAAAAAPKSDNNGLGWHRGPKPEMAYQCRNLDDVLAAVQYEVQTHCQGLIPEEVSWRLQFPVAAALEYPKIQDAETAVRPLSKCTNEVIDPDPCSGYSVAAALSNFFDAKEKLQYQRVVARTIIAGIGAADGFKYSERRASDTAKGDGYRFSYVCRDSLQNKDRRANRGQVDGEVVGPGMDFVAVLHL